MYYDRIEFKDATTAIRECDALGRTLRYCDDNGVTVNPASEPHSIIESLNPAWALSDPAPEPASVPAPSRIVSKLDYMSRFTDAELATIFTVAKTEVAIEVWLEKFRIAEFVDLDNASTQSGVHALELFGLIGTGRAGEILDA